MKKTFKIIGVLALVLTLVANLQYAFIGYDVQNNPNLLHAQYPPNTSSPINPYPCPASAPGPHGEFYWFAKGSPYYITETCPQSPPRITTMWTNQGFTQRFTVISSGSNCGPYDGYTTGYAIFTVASTQVPC